MATKSPRQGWIGVTNVHSSTSSNFVGKKYVATTNEHRRYLQHAIPSLQGTEIVTAFCLLQLFLYHGIVPADGAYPYAPHQRGCERWSRPLGNHSSILQDFVAKTISSWCSNSPAFAQKEWILASVSGGSHTNALCFSNEFDSYIPKS